MKVSFNLVSEPWIPVQTFSGEFKRVSLKTLFSNATNYLNIETESPLVEIALYRFLLAILHRALEGPKSIEDCVEWYLANWPLKKINQYLDRWFDRFDLFHPETPFFQIADLPENENEIVSWTKLAAERSSGNNPLLFDHSIDDNPVCISVSEAACYLLGCQTFSLGGGKSNFCLPNVSDSPFVNGAFTIALDENLHKTLLLNLSLYTQSMYEEDKPIWEKEKYTLKSIRTNPKKTLKGICEGFTWLSRSIKLLPIIEGNKIVVREILLASGLKPDIYNEFLDPMLAYSVDEKRGYKIIKMDPDKLFWRNFIALCPNNSNKRSISPNSLKMASQIYSRLEKWIPIRIKIVGIARKQAKVNLWRSEHYSLDSKLLHNDFGYEIIDSCLSKAEDLGKKLKDDVGYLLAKNLLSIGDRKLKNEVIDLLRKSFPLLEIYWSRLENRFHQLLSSLTSDSDPNEVLKNWNDKLIREARYAWNETVNSLGTSARELKAIQLSVSKLNYELSKLKKIN